MKIRSTHFPAAPSQRPGGNPFMVSFPYYSHISRDSYGSGMGIVWETYCTIKESHYWGVPENPTDLWEM